MGRKFRDPSWCSLNRGCPLNMGPLNTGFTVADLQSNSLPTDIALDKVAHKPQVAHSAGA